MNWFDLPHWDIIRSAKYEALEREDNFRRKNRQPNKKGSKCSNRQCNTREVAQAQT